MLFNITSASDAIASLVYFNHFHDGFLETVAVRASPDGHDAIGFGVPVTYELTMTVIHSNYPSMQVNAAIENKIRVTMNRLASLRIEKLIELDPMIQAVRIIVDDDGVIHINVDDVLTCSCTAMTIEELGCPAQTRGSGESASP